MVRAELGYIAAHAMQDLKKVRQMKIFKVPTCMECGFVHAGRARRGWSSDKSASDIPVLASWGLIIKSQTSFWRCAHPPKAVYQA